MKESKIQSQILKWLRSQENFYVVNTAGGATRAGVPDILVCYKGLFIGLEVKSNEKTAKVSELQKHNMEKISAAGGISIIVDSLAATQELFKDLSEVEKNGS